MKIEMIKEIKEEVEAEIMKEMKAGIETLISDQALGKMGK